MQNNTTLAANYQPVLSGDRKSDHAANQRLSEGLAAKARGWALIPLNGKVPILKRWQKGPPATADKVSAWDSAGYNLGVRTGSASGVVTIRMPLLTPRLSVRLAVDRDPNPQSRAAVGSEMKNGRGYVAMANRSQRHHSRSSGFAPVKLTARAETLIAES